MQVIPNGTKNRYCSGDKIAEETNVTFPFYAKAFVQLEEKL